jgi:Fic family protein
MAFAPRFTITNAITSALTRIERARGFLQAARLSEDWISGMQQRALVLEAHHTTHIEGTHLTLEQAERLLAGQSVPGVDPDDVRELLNYREAFDLVADYLGGGRPITEALIREIHRRLVRGMRGDSAGPGEYRTVIRKDVILLTARKAGVKDRALGVLAFLLDKGKGSVAECEAALGGNRRTLQRDLKRLVDEKLVEEISTGPTDPTKYYRPRL